jgi:hypothetical protein
MKNIAITVFIAALLVGLITACTSTGLGSSPQQVITQELVDHQKVDPATIHFHQSLPGENSTFLFVSFQQTDPDGGLGNCEGVYATQAVLSNWWVAHGGSTCRSAPQVEPATLQSGINGADGEEQISYTYGLTKIPAARQVEITWKDGEVQRVHVIQNSYLALREGKHHPSGIEVLDAAGNSVHAVQIGDPAPGKEEAPAP